MNGCRKLTISKKHQELDNLNDRFKVVSILVPRKPSESRKLVNNFYKRLSMTMAFEFPQVSCSGRQAGRVAGEVDGEVGFCVIWFVFL